MKYKLRCECLHDAQLLINKLLAFTVGQLRFSADFLMIGGKRMPDLTLEIEVNITLDEVKGIIRQIPDSHVMLETVTPLDEYTGERTPAT